MITMTMTAHVEIPHTAGVASSREPTPPSVRIVSMQDSNTASASYQSHIQLNDGYELVFIPSPSNHE
jgi:hypothetical protein